VNYFMKWPEGYAVPNQEAPTVAKALVTNFFCRFGIPRGLHTDQERIFQFRLLQEALQRLGVSKTLTTPLHPQSDGMVERYIENGRGILTKGLRIPPQRLGRKICPSNS
jgi:hypothetical protein